MDNRQEVLNKCPEEAVPFVEELLDAIEYDVKYVRDLLANAEVESLSNTIEECRKALSSLCDDLY